MRVLHPRLLASAAVLVAASTIAPASTPTVVSTSPANGATGIAGTLADVVVTFSEAMGGGVSLNSTPTSFASFAWSPDSRRLTMQRGPGAPALADGTVVTVTLNPPPYLSFADLEGNFLGTYAFSFTVGADMPGAPTVVSTVPANGATGVMVGLSSIDVTFSEPMGQGTDVTVSGDWSVGSAAALSWSGDGRTLSIGRDDLPDPLPNLAAVTVHLNRSGHGFADAAGTTLGAYSLSFTTAPPDASQKPVVSDSDPAHGSRTAGRFMDTVSITFSKPMESGHDMTCDAGDWNLTGSVYRWSQDRRTLSVTRPDGDRLLPAGQVVQFTLNPSGQEGFVDTDGNPLETCTYGFTVETAARLLKVLPEESSYDFDWPYYLWLPPGIESATSILVEPNNSGFISDVELDHDSSAMALLGWRSSFAARLGVPLLVPTFPRPRSRWWVYTHALDRDSLTTPTEGIERIDLQLIEMIGDARERLADLGVEAGPKVLMMGFSASGQFTNRFAILHPDRVLAAAAGSPGGWPLAPVATWNGETLPYNVGVADADSLLGQPIDPDQMRRVPLFLYMGDADTNDSVPYSDGYDDGQRELVNRLFGTSPVARWPHAEAIYEAAGMNATFALYPGVGHTITADMFADVEAFLRAHLEAAHATRCRPVAGRRTSAP
jgi:hypothetical protein